MANFTPNDLNLSTVSDFCGLVNVESRTRTNVSCPDFTLASTMNLPMCPVPPMIKILLFSTAMIDYVDNNLGVGDQATYKRGNGEELYEMFLFLTVIYMLCSTGSVGIVFFSI